MRQTGRLAQVKRKEGEHTALPEHQFIEVVRKIIIPIESARISMHQFPKNPVVQNKWVKFVQRHHADFQESSVTKYTSLCSTHFQESYYMRKISLDLGKHSKQDKVVIGGAIPTTDSVVHKGTDTLIEQRKHQVSELNKSLTLTSCCLFINSFQSINRVVSLLG